MRLPPLRPSRTAPIFLAAVAFLLGTGCATRTHYNVVSFTTPAAEMARSYVLDLNRTGQPARSLRNQEVAEIVKSALASRGLHEAPSREAADMVVRVEIKVEGPLLKLIDTADSYNDSSSPGGEPVVRYRDKQIEVYYEKTTLVLTAVEKSPPRGQAPDIIWQVEVAQEASKANVRAALPVLAARSVDYIREESGGTVDLPEDAPRTVQHVPNRSRQLAR
jgi:hypothetical protein